jgi:ATP-dependent Clp protease protease subunit
MAISPSPILPPEVYAVFCDGINPESAKRIFNGMTTAMANKVAKIHLLFQSNGGFVGDGIALYNFFRTLPLDLTIYNVGQVSSVAVVAYLGAKRRKTGAHTMFMMHRTKSAGIPATATELKGIAKSLTIDDERIETILAEHITLSNGRWSDLDDHDFYFSGEEAVKMGIAHEIGEFAPPPGTQVYNI